MVSSTITDSLPAVHALHLAELMPRFGVRAETLLADAGLDAAALAEPGARLPVSEAVRLVERARVLAREPGIGFFLGLQMRISAHGHLGFAAMTAGTAREALELGVRFAPTRTAAIGLRLREHGARAALVLEERADFGPARDAIMFAIAVGIWKMGEMLTGRPLEGELDLAFPEPAYARRFTSLATSKLRFEQPVTQLVFPASVLELPIVMADPEAQKLAREQCQRELDALGLGAAGVVPRVRALVALAGGPPPPEEQVARTLGMSVRTLKRRLAEAGTSFTALVDEARRERALLLLRSPELSLDQIAAQLGYSDAANFTRAFRRWTGRTPGSLRPPRRGGPSAT